MRTLTVLMIVVLAACQPEAEIKSGDILFRGKSEGSLSSAIDEVTQTYPNFHFTHMGVVQVKNGEVMVWHATPDKGVVCEALQAFSSENGEDSVVIGHFRIKNISEQSIESALKLAKQYKGQPYDYTYIMESRGFYCSEFVYALFEKDSVFTLDPMTFKNPKTGAFHQGWIDHYQKMGIEIPEGKPGCNPNGMAASDKLEFLGYLSN
nr:YiiX/YebB-like N1pC/P60 family cysteine hydrolase [uncultured Carboxylicivirga sp.]